MNPKLNHPLVQKEVDFTRLIVMMDFGSTVYGTALPSSDTDFKGVFLPTGRDIVLGRTPSTKNIHTNDSGSGVRNSVDDVDMELFSVYRYLELLSQGQTVALDMIFCPERHIQSKTGVWDWIVDNKTKFINKKCGAAIGYAKAQASKYSLRGHRLMALEKVLDLLEPYYKKNSRMTLGDVLEHMGFTEAYAANHNGGGVVKCYKLWDLIKADAPKCLDYISFPSEKAPHLPDGEIQYLEVCNKKAGLTSSIKFAYDIFKNELAGYGDRARAAKDGGADWKAMYHAIRIAEQTVELMETGHITFPRPEAPYLLKVRRGEVRVEEASQKIEEGIERILKAQERSSLPDSSDKKVIDDLVYKLYFNEVTKG